MNVGFFFFFRFSSSNWISATGVPTKQSRWSDSTLIKLLPVFEDLQRNVSRMQKAEYYIKGLCCGACWARRDVKIKMHPRALSALCFAYGGRTAACMVSVRRLLERRGCLKTLCRVCWQNCMASDTDKSMVVKHTNKLVQLLHCLRERLAERRTHWVTVKQTMGALHSLCQCMEITL